MGGWGGRRDSSGRPPRAGGATRIVALRLSDEERARWEEAAEAAGLSLSEWIRSICERAIKRATNKGG
jgi:predicted HicB family RNase H-like nuclease